MEDVTITGLERVREMRPSKNGHIILAYFSADVGVFSLKGCVLVRTARQGIAAWMPRLDDQRSHNNRAITLHDETTRNALLQAAREMYITMGGTEAEWRPRANDEDEGLHPHRGSDAEGWPTHPLHPNYTPPEADEGEDRAGLKTFLGSKDGN